MQAIKHAICAIVQALRGATQHSDNFADDAIYSGSWPGKLNIPQKEY